MPNFYAGQQDYIEKLNLLATIEEIGGIAANVTAAAASEAAAEAAAAEAASSSGVSVWVSGTVYPVGTKVYSPSTYQTFRRLVAGDGTIDPAADPTNWGGVALNNTTLGLATPAAAKVTDLTVTNTVQLAALTATTALALNASKEIVSTPNTGTGNNVLAESPALTGTPTAPTAVAGTSTTQIASTAFTLDAVNTAIANLIDTSPTTLNTLNELAASLGNDANFATTVTNSLALKAPLDSPALTGAPTAPTAAPGDSTTQIATTAFVTSVDVLKAPLSSPALTGTPTAPTAAPGDSTTQIATTAFVTSVDVLKAPLYSPALTGTPTAPTATPGDSTTQIATTAFVTSIDVLKAPLSSPALTGTPTAPTATPGDSTTQIATTAFVTSVDVLKAPLSSPALTGTPTAPTAAPGDSTTQIATTAFTTGAVTTAVANLINSSPAALDTINELAASMGNDANFATTVTNSLALKAPLYSPALTGTPTAPTAAPGDSTTQLATTAFVTVADNLKAPLASPALTGTPTAPTPATGTNTTQVATTAFVNANAVIKTSDIGSMRVPSGTTAEEPVSPQFGDMRGNVTTGNMVWWNGFAWTGMGGGAVGGSTDAAFYENDTLITAPYTIGQGAMFPATISIASPAVITQANTYVAGQKVRFTTTGALPTGLDINGLYFVSATGLTTSSFQVSLTAGGASVVTTGTQSGTHSAGKIKNAAIKGPITIGPSGRIIIPTGARLGVK